MRSLSNNYLQGPKYVRFLSLIPPPPLFVSDDYIDSFKSPFYIVKQPIHGKRFPNVLMYLSYIT